MSFNKKKLRIALYIYIAIMVVLIFSSKTIYNFSLPKVTVVVPQSGKLTKEVSSYGSVTFSETFAVFAEADGQIDKMLVKNGDYVKKGDVIARYKKTDPEINIPALKSPRDGIVLYTEKEDGVFTFNGERVVLFGVANNEYCVDFLCDGSDGEFIEPGDIAELFITGIGTVSASVREMSGQDDKIKIRLAFEAENIKGNEYVKIQIKKQTPTCDAIVPNEAVFKDAQGSYVWVVRNKQGALGVEYFSTKIRIFIADSDDYNSAISKGLEFIEPVVVSFDKDLSVNGRVRRME